MTAHHDSVSSTSTGPYLDARQAADFLRCSTKVLALWRHKKKGPAYMRCGTRKVVYSANDLVAFLESNRVESPLARSNTVAPAVAAVEP